MNTRHAALLVSILVLGGDRAVAQEYSIVDLGTLGGSSSTAVGINWDGIVAGRARDASGGQRAVLWDAGGIVDLGVPAGFAGSESDAVNESGQAAVTALGSPQAYRAYLWQDGVWTDLGVLPGRSESRAAAIDPYGRIAGSSYTLGASDKRAFLWEGGPLLDLGTLGGDASAEGMNDRREVVGSSRLGGAGTARHAFIWRDGVMTDLGVLPGEEHSIAYDIDASGDVAGSSWHTETSLMLQAEQATLWHDRGAQIVDLGPTPGPPACVSGYPYYTVNTARALNNCGQVVGDARCLGGGGPAAAFVWQDGVMQNLNDLVPAASGWNLLTALDVNDRGEIVGAGTAPNGELHAYLLEPSSPPGCPLRIGLDAGHISWNAQPGAVGYDVVRGDLATLEASAGDFTRATIACLADDTTATMTDDPVLPAPGGGFWLLVRLVSGTGPGSYDDGSSPVASRDTGIDASPDACP